MAVDERDPHTGHRTTGHEWNGIRELNTPVPKLVWAFLVGTVVFSVVWWVLMPAWPLGVSYTRGLLGIDQRTEVEEALRQAAMDRSMWTARIEASGFEEIRADATLMGIVRETGHPLFEDNCAVCHGRDAKGGKGFPDLTDAAWLWGGEPETVAETIRVGINAEHEETRRSQMMAFGRDQILDRRAVQDVVAHVRSLSGPRPGAGDRAAAAESGAAIFAENCAACHGEAGRGTTEVGAPDLGDGFWLYGGDRQSVFTTVWNGRQGRMPAWEARLTPVERKILTLYLLDLGADRDEPAPGGGADQLAAGRP